MRKILFSNVEESTLSELPLHLSVAVGLYKSAAVVSSLYQGGITISIMPEPPGDIVVFGVKAAVKVFIDAVFPRMSLLDES